MFCQLFSVLDRTGVACHGLLIIHTRRRRRLTYILAQTPENVRVHMPTICDVDNCGLNQKERTGMQLHL